MEESHRDLEGGREDRFDMREFGINYSVVILSRADGKGSHDLSSVSCIEDSSRDSSLRSE